MGSFGCRSGRGRARTTSTSLPALRRHYRVCPQWLVVGSLAGPVGYVGDMRGARAPATRTGAAAHLVAALGLRGGIRDASTRVGSGASSEPWPRGPDRSSGCRERSQRSPRWPRAHLPARGRRGLRASSRELRRTGHPGVHGAARVSLAGATPKRGDSGLRPDRSREAAFARPSGRLTERGRHPEVEARVREGGSRGCLPGSDRPRSEEPPGRHAAGHPTTPSLGFVPFRRIQHGRS